MPAWDSPHRGIGAVKTCKCVGTGQILIAYDRECLMPMDILCKLSALILALRFLEGQI